MERAKILGDQESLAVIRAGSKKSRRAEREVAEQLCVQCFKPHSEQELSLGRESRPGNRIPK